MADLKSELKPGDEVAVYANGLSSYRATVEEIGRTLVHLRHGQGSRTTTFRPDTQRLNEPAYGYATRFRPLAQDAMEKRGTAARRALEDRGPTTRHGHAYTTEQLEQIATLIDTFKEKADG
ncbi:beta barrel domain-containing protein [Actinocorallia populi]|uniref:beta barrel domain-containing protein n=1 Tax=Actinocorallia populi TaxID=2079200 RepID=UPI000D08B327|nr:hypothetical protein [Actinocorallia populi]